jgi:uncharacterized protein
MTMPILPFYAALFGLVFVYLSVRTLLLRRRLRISIGDGDSPEMLRAMRVHSNFAEYVPLSLILIYFVEVQGGHPLFLHTLCIALLAGRLCHAFGVSRTVEDYRFRVFGMAMTFTAIILASLALLAGYLL